jgi:hypothetical protein
MAFEAGFIACLRKPWEEEALLQIVTKVLAQGVKPPSIREITYSN